MSSVQKKIDRERNVINAAQRMRQSTNNPAIHQQAETRVKEAQRNLDYLEGRMRELHLRRSGGPTPPSHGQLSQDQGRSAYPGQPPEAGRGYRGQASGYGNPRGGGYSVDSRNGMPPQGPFEPQPPDSTVPKARPNFSKLGLFLSLHSLRVRMLTWSTRSS